MSTWDARAVTFVHAFGDAEAMDLHFEGAEERARAAYELLEPDGWEIYGRPSKQALESMRRSADSFGVDLRVSARIRRWLPPPGSADIVTWGGEAGGSSRVLAEHLQ